MRLVHVVSGEVADPLDAISIMIVFNEDWGRPQLARLLKTLNHNVSVIYGRTPEGKAVIAKALAESFPDLYRLEEPAPGISKT